MKKIFTILTFALLLTVPLSILTSCSTGSSISKAFSKNGYIMGQYTWDTQKDICPILSKFPAFNETALGYLQIEGSYTFIYSVNQTTWDSYCNKLTNNGFENMGIGFIKVNQNTGVTYNISGKFTTIYKQTYLLVTYTSTKF